MNIRPGNWQKQFGPSQILWIIAIPGSLPTVCVKENRSPSVHFAYNILQLLNNLNQQQSDLCEQTYLSCDVDISVACNVFKTVGKIPFVPELNTHEYACHNDETIIRQYHKI